MKQYLQHKKGEKYLPKAYYLLSTLENQNLNKIYSLLDNFYTDQKCL